MADIALTATINRDLLGLPPLNISNGAPYYLSPQFLGSTVAWDRQSVSSRWVDGDVTTGRRRANVTEQIGVEVRADDAVALRAAVTTLVAAFSQDRFTLTVTVGGAIYAYDCEAADVTNAMWTTPRLAACQAQVVFGVPRRPVALAGV